MKAECYGTSRKGAADPIGHNRFALSLGHIDCLQGEPVLALAFLAPSADLLTSPVAFAFIFDNGIFRKKSKQRRCILLIDSLNVSGNGRGQLDSR